MFKAAIMDCSTVQPIDYASEQPVTLTVDPLYITVSYILFQNNKNGHCQPSHFGSIIQNNQEFHYSQAKLELYGLFWVLHAVKVWIIGIKNLVVEVDAKYIKGMLNNPDIQPNAAMNHWIVEILTFNFILKHVPIVHHKGSDGLSRQWRVADNEEDKEEMSEEVEDWIDKVFNCNIWILQELKKG